MKQLGRKLILGFALSGLSLSVPSHAEEKKESSPITFGAFVDTYYAWDLNNPPGRDRVCTVAGCGVLYSTQPTRHNEFNLNLAHLEAKLNTDRTHGRLALQTGTSVEANYSGEPAVGTGFSNIDFNKLVQEAYVGYRLAEGLWVDVGVFFSHIGPEGWISRDNWTYSRFLGSDLSPYYQNGLRVTYQLDPVWSAQLHVLNGWQRISETDTDKAVGAQVAYAPTSTFSVTYNNFFGREGASNRLFHDLVIKTAVTDSLQIMGVADLGMQLDPGATRNWYNFGLVARYQLASEVAVAARGEYYLDKDRVIVNTGTPDGFQTFGASLNVDWQLGQGVVWRNEVRGLFSKDAVFLGRTGATKQNGFLVSSLALSI